MKWAITVRSFDAEAEPYLSVSAMVEAEDSVNQLAPSPRRQPGFWTFPVCDANTHTASASSCSATLARSGTTSRPSCSGH